MLLIIVLFVAYKRKIILIKNIENYFLLLSLSIPLLFAVTYPNSFHTLLSYLVFTLLFQSFTMYLIDVTKFVPAMMNYLLLTSVFASLFGLYLVFISNDMSILGIPFSYDIFFTKRMNSWFNNSTMLGLYLSFGLLSIFYQWDKSSFYIKILLIFSSIIILSALVLSGGRTGIFLIMLIIFIHFILFYISKIKYFILSIVVLSLVTISVYMNFEYLSENIYFIRRLTNSDLYNMGGRSEKALFALNIMNNMTFNDLLFGLGINYIITELDYSIHSGALRIILEFGLIVFFIFNIYMIMLIINTFKYYLKYKKKISIYLMYFYIFIYLKEFMVIGHYGININYILFLIFMTIDYKTRKDSHEKYIYNT
jgi:hypothetical protein